MANTNFNAPETTQIGVNVYKAGIIAQEVVLVLAICLALSFQWKLSKAPSTRSTSWRPLVGVVYATLILMTVSCILTLLCCRT